MVRFFASLLVLTLCAVAWSGTANAGSSGRIDVRLFIDHGGDGQFDPGDVPLANEGVRAWGPTPVQDQTNADGRASLGGLTAGDYDVGSTNGTFCSDYLSNNWLGVYILGFCTTNEIPSVIVTIEDSETVSVDLAIQGVQGHIGGRLWLDGAPAPDGTHITARSGGVVCAEDTIKRYELARGIAIANFSLEFPTTPLDPACNGETLGLFAGERQFAETTRSQLWARSLMSWRFGTTYYSTSEYASPPLFGPYFGATDLDRASVRAIVGDTVCGAQVSDNSVVYGLIVLSEEIKAGCGSQGEAVQFCLGGNLAGTVLTWEDSLGQSFLPSSFSSSDTPCPATAVVGDTDCDSTVTTIDASLALEHIADIGAAPTHATCLTDADTDCNRKVEIPDVLAILRHLAAVSAPSGGECPPVGQPNY